MTPWLSDPDVTLYHGDVLQVLRELPAESVDCCVTSPPYWGLRDYGTGAWEGGDAECDHTPPKQPDRKFRNSRGEGRDDDYAGTNCKAWTDRDGTTYRDTCGKCGATRIDQQLGLEPTPEEYVTRMVEVFREVRRVLAPHGTVWLNLGDSYVGALSQHKPRTAWEGGDENCEHLLCEAVSVLGVDVLDDAVADELPETHLVGAGVLADGAPQPEAEAKGESGLFEHKTNVRHGEGCVKCGARLVTTSDTFGHNSVIAKKTQSGVPKSGRIERGRALREGGLKPKDLVGIPWRVAFALQADGWYLRSDIIWAKPNPMPESVTDRPTKSHEYLFLLSKNPRYYFDAEAVRERHTSTRWGGPTITQPPTTKYAEATADGFNGAAEALSRPGREWNAYPEGGRNIRSVWEIATQPYPEAHFATFPEELARRCIAAGTSERGKCPECGAPWVREVERERPTTRDARVERLAHIQTQRGNPGSGGTNSTTFGISAADLPAPKTIGWRPTCACSCGVPQQVDDWQDEVTISLEVHRRDESDEGERISFEQLEAEVGLKTPPATVPCVVLDPFIGSGTVAHVARKLGRHAVGIDLNESYLELAARRLQQQSLFAGASGV